jgi:hypothetical protein
MKVIPEPNAVLVVADDYGETMEVEGVVYKYEPLPICRVPIGWGRTEAEAKELAVRIAEALAK